MNLQRQPQLPPLLLEEERAAEGRLMPASHCFMQTVSIISTDDSTPAA